MSRRGRLLSRIAGLPPADNDDVTVERDLKVEMPDGAILLADRWLSPSVPHAPVVLVRTPYGRATLGGLWRVFARRGYQVVVQSCRGTFGSGGEWEPFFHERADGKATLEWLVAQPWCVGPVGMFGPSYMGLTQWAVADEPPPQLAALALQVTAARVRDSVIFPGGSFCLETGAAWLHQLEFQERGPRRLLLAIATSRRRMRPAFAALPLADADTLTLGRRIACYQDWLVHDRPDDPWWDPIDFSGDVGKVPPASMVGGWYDIFLPAQVGDFAKLRDAGRQVRLTIGPWTHASPRGGAAGLRDTLDWFGFQLRGRSSPDLWEGVRLFVMGSRRWVHLDTWPPPSTLQRWHLHAGGSLAVGGPASGSPDSYRYDPADPTPGVGGPSLDVFTAGRRNQRRRERRADVLTYTSDVLSSPVTVAGPIRAEIWVRASQPHTDVFLRLCDVDRRGRSRNLSDGILRLEPSEGSVPSDGVRRVEVSMWPTANTFRVGHRIRLQVSSGAHPLFARNPGSGEPLGGATTLVASDQEVFHDPDHPSAIVLPVSDL